MIAKLIIYIKIYYYSFREWLSDDVNPEILSGDIRHIEQSKQNVKLIRGVKKLVERLRAMRPEDRTKVENLLCKESYKKTKQELLEELRVRHKVMNNPLMSTEDDLVNKVVQQAPAYAREAELREVRKQITACLKAASQNPKDSSYTEEAKRLKARRDVLIKEIARIKNG